MDPRRAVALRSALSLLALAAVAVGTWDVFDRHVVQAGLRARALALSASEVVLLDRVSRLSEQCLHLRPAELAPALRELSESGDRLEAVSRELTQVATAAVPKGSEPWAVVLSGPGGLAVAAAGLATRLRALGAPERPDRAALREILASADGLLRASDSLRDDLERESEDAVRRLREYALALLGLALAAVAGLGALIVRPAWRSLRRQISRLGALFEATVNSLADGVVVVDRQGRIIEMNPAARAMLGARPDGDGAEWARIAERLHPRQPDGRPLRRDDVPVLKAIRRGTIEEAEVFIEPPSRPGGLWISTRASPLRDPAGDVEGGVSIFRDITPRKRLEEELRRKTEELARSNAELERFASIASHEMQEPMRKIAAFGERLRQRSGASLPPESREDLDRIEKAAHRMIRLMENLLRYAKVNLKTNGFEKIPLEEVLEDVLSDLDEQLRSTGGLVEHDRLPSVRGDRSQLEQVFRNLISNGLKFRRPEAAPRVRISVQETPEHWEIAFSDEGIGFDPIYTGQLFQPFSRLHPRDRYEGSGMGLAIARRIALRHGGELTAEGRPGLGATFRLRLPKAKAEAA